MSIARQVAEGFEGSVAGLGLTDVVQMNALNHFSGSIAVESGGQRGLLYFRDGEIIHAEAGALRGEEALYDIMGWSAGRFEQHANVTTTTRSIQRGWKFLLMDAIRVVDERRRRAGPPALPSSSKHAPRAPAEPAQGRSLLERIRAVRGVRTALLQTRDGRATPEGGAPAPQAAALARLGQRLGAAFHVGDLVAATAQGASAHVLLLATRTAQLGIVLEGAGAEAAEAEIRQLLSAKR